MTIKKGTSIIGKEFELKVIDIELYSLFDDYKFEPVIYFKRKLNGANDYYDTYSDKIEKMTLKEFYQGLEKYEISLI